METCRKKTDIQIAISMYADAAQNQCDVVVLCTNDSDMEPAFQRILLDCPEIEIGFIAASRPSINGTPSGRQPNKSLKKLAHWTRQYIQDTELTAAQMPTIINTGQGTVSKPLYWK